MNIQDFIFSQRQRIIEVISEYVAGNINHSRTSEAAWEAISNFENVEVPPNTPYLKGEDTFWATVWAMQHLADEEHWSEGVTQKELSRYLDLLENERELPTGETGLRPNDT